MKVRSLTKRILSSIGGLALLTSTLVAVAGPVHCGDRPIRWSYFDYGFFYDPAEGGKGIDKDILDELIKRTGCRFDAKLLPRARSWADVASGDLDMFPTGIPNAERERFAWFANYMAMKNYAIVHSRDAASIKRAEDFIANKSLKFGVVRSFKHGTEQDQWLDQLRKEQRVQESPDAETVYKKLKEQHVDAMFSQPPVYRKNLKLLGMENMVTVQDWTPSERGAVHGLVLSKSRFSEAEAEKWRAVMLKMREDGTLKKIFSRYLPADEVAKILEY
ncbi:MAG: transporter substrate-binding domain-containing protein [Rhodoferax sp.]|nr:transporter substrate-binding domain-containing protein [Rhodoferax sp.]